VEKLTSLDNEWIALMKEARDHGFTKQEILDFLKNPPLFMKNSSSSENKLVLK
jgi:Anti-repressor SinI